MFEPFLKRNVSLLPWSTKWGDQFAAESKAWRELMGPGCLDLQHIGSTAVPGMVAKPIIDILVVVSSHREIDRLTPQIVQMGYEVKSEHGIPGRRYFQKDVNGDRVFHIHAYEEGHSEIHFHLRFRDLLRSNPSLANEYGRLKIELAGKYRYDKPAYARGKSPFIQRILGGKDDLAGQS